MVRLKVKEGQPKRYGLPGGRWIEPGETFLWTHVPKGAVDLLEVVEEASPVRAPRSGPVPEPAPAFVESEADDAEPPWLEMLTEKLEREPTRADIVAYAREAHGMAVDGRMNRRALIDAVTAEVD